MAHLDVDDVIALLRADGGRATSARRAILTALFDASPRHPTAEQIATAVRTAQPDVAESTVYRFLEELGRLGVVQAVHIGDGPTAYHLAHGANHHHLRCTQCGRMTEVPDAAFAAIRRSVLRDHGFEIDARHLTLNGRCAECIGAARTRGPT